MGVQSAETDDQNQLQAGMRSYTCHHLFTPIPPPDLNS